MDALPLFRRIVAHGERQGDRPALIARSESVGWKDFALRVAGTAEALKRRGLQPGDRVILSSANAPSLAIAYFGIHASGGTACPLPPDMPAPSVGDIAERLGSRFVVGDRDDLDALPLSITEQQGESGALAKPGSSTEADILFTSGTTGRPKGVVLTHANIAAAAQAIAGFVRNREDDLEAVPLPLSHSFGLGRLRSMAIIGNAMLIETGLSNVPGTFKRMLKARATGLALVPTGVEILRSTLGDHVGALADQLRYMEIGSAPMRAETREWLRDILPNTRIYHHYGLTEASRAAFLHLTDQAPPGSVGKPSPGYEIGIRTLGEGGGEILVRGPAVASRYLDDPCLTADRMTADGFRTGDIGRIDSEGWLFLEGRGDDMINVGGKKVNPAAVETALEALPGVAEAGCCGVEDAHGLLGQVVAAAIVIERDARPDISGALLAPHERPARVLIVDALPKTASGKLQRTRIGALFAAVDG